MVYANTKNVFLSYFEHTPENKMTEVSQPIGAHLNGSIDVIMGNSTGSNLRFSSGLILPPPEIKGAFNQVMTLSLLTKLSRN